MFDEDEVVMLLIVFVVSDGMILFYGICMGDVLRVVK